MKIPTLLILTITVSSLHFANCQKEEAFIDTGDDQLGKIQGSYGWVTEGPEKIGRKYYWFAGLPYADPNSYIRENRFKVS